MNVQVFDTHVKTHTGQYLHFDVLVTPEQSGHAETFAQQFLQQQGIASAEIAQQSCAFCHNEIATPAVIAAIRQHGYYILKLEGC